MKKGLHFLVILLLLISGSTFSQSVTDSFSFKSSFNYGKSVAVFGGSVSVIPASDSAKIFWQKYLGMKVTNFGVSGAQAFLHCRENHFSSR